MLITILIRISFFTQLFTLCFYWVFDFLFLRIIPKYKQFKESEKTRWKDIAISSLHSICCSIGVFIEWCLLPYEYKFQYFNTTFPWRVSFWIYFSLGYFTFHLFDRVLPDIKHNGWIVVVHHLISMFTLTYTIIIKKYAVGVLILLFMELSSPFLANVYFLIKLDLRKSWWFTLNGVSLILTWIISRLPTAFHLFYIYYLCWDKVLERSIFERIYYPLIVSFFGILNWYWFYRIIKGILNPEEIDLMIQKKKFY